MKKEFLLPEGYLTPNEYRTVRDAISKLPPVAAGVADPNDPMHKSAAHKQSTIDVIRQVPHDGGSRPEGVGPECLDRVRAFTTYMGACIGISRLSLSLIMLETQPAVDTRIQNKIVD